MIKCSKCNSLTINGIYVEGGNSYTFCDICMKILDSIPGTNKIINYLGTQKVESQVDKNMRLARKRRAKGKFIW
jgi:hypothetical protein